MFEIVSLYTMTLSSTTGDIKKMLDQNDLIEGEDHRVGIVSQSVIRNVPYHLLPNVGDQDHPLTDLSQPAQQGC